VSSSETIARTAPGEPTLAGWLERTHRRRTISLVSLVAAAIMYPGLASATTVALYVSGWLPDARAFAVGAGLGAVATLLLSPALRRYAVADRANIAAYGHLSTSLGRLDADLGAFCGNPQTDGEPGAASAEARQHRDAVARELGLAGDGAPPSAGIQWLLANGYTNMWVRLHRAEEALIEIAPDECVIREVVNDDLRLQGSTIPNAGELLRRLRLAAEDLGPSAARYLGRPSEAERAGGGAQRERVARAIVREVRRSVNDFRDDCREGIVRGRNRLYATVMFTGLTTFGLLGLAVVAEAGVSEIVAATAFYLVGGVVGLFRQLRSASAADAMTEEDYGLSIARLLQTPLFSGLAAVGGVVVTALLSAVVPVLGDGQPATDQLPTLSEIFSLADNRVGLVVAAVFGLTPSLLISRLHGQVEKYKSDLRASETAQRAPSASPPA
jgi:hypothetical protein